MATVYRVEDRVIVGKTTLDEVKESGLKSVGEMNIRNRHALKFTMAHCDAKIEAVLIYEAAGDNFTGVRI